MNDPRKTTDLELVAVDLDGTLAQKLWTLENPTDEIGDPIWLNIHKLYELRRDGWKVVIHTSRPWQDYIAIKTWLACWGIIVDGVICGKVLAAAYIDDRAIHESAEEWNPTHG